MADSHNAGVLFLGGDRVKVRTFGEPKEYDLSGSNDLPAELEKLIVSVRGRGMYVQKNLATDDESSTTAIDAVLEDCVQQYRSLGMTFDEIDGHLQAITKAMRSEARSAAEEREEYYGVE